ncbi:MAG: hypothetical protein ACOH2L_18045 [Devosia sp.]
MVNKNAFSPEQLLALIEAVIRDAPQFGYEDPLTQKELRWLGRADALIEASEGLPALVSFRNARRNLNTYAHSRNDLLLPLHDAYSRMELMSPAASQGAFIPAGDTWNGYAALIKIVQSECDDILIVDPYLNSAIFTDFAPHSSARKCIRCLTAQRPTNHAGLVASAARWASDEISNTHTVEVRYGDARALHDRLIIIDSREVWLVSQSFKDIAKRSPASVSRADSDMSLMKTQHYEDLWVHSTKLAGPAS